MRGIGVAVSTSMSTASPLRGERVALMHAEAMLLVDDREREVLERDILLEQRVRADQEIDLTDGEAIERLIALASAFASGEDRNPQTRGCGKRDDGREVLVG